MELGSTIQHLYLVGPLVLVCALVLYRRSHARPATQRHESRSKQSLDTRLKPQIRPAVDVVHPDPSIPVAEEPEVDIVAVHGLGSQVDWSWTWKDEFNGQTRYINWLKDSDMLPSILPKARILIHNYDSRWHMDAPKTRLQICGEELVNAVLNARNGISDRPLIFIGHSLGGNVIQHGLLYSESEPKFKHLVEVTVGLIFLGCPFKGSKIQRLATVVANALHWAGSDTGILRDLGYGDSTLIDKLNAFQRLLERNSIPVCAFIERKETDYGRKIGLSGIFKGLVVDEESAGALGPHKIHLNTDHLKINKYCGPQDPSFVAVSGQINEMFTNWRPLIQSRKSNSSSQKTFLESRARHEKIVHFLAKFDFSTRYKHALSTRHKDTGQWFLEAEAFRKWVAADGETLWCPGIPGAGKTTLFAVAVHHLQETLDESEVALLFAYCDYQDRPNQSAENMILSLWRQLMRKRQLSEAECEQLETRFLKKELLPTSDDLIRMISDEFTRYRRVFIMLDALDELSSESRDALLSILLELPTQRNLLVTSRLPTVKASPFEDAPELEIRAKETDVADYINGRLLSSWRLRNKIEHSKRLKEEIRSTITKKADGMFLLVRLHLDSLATAHTIKDVHSRLKDLPEGENSVSHTYEAAIARIHDQALEDRKLGERIILWISHAQRPLTLEDLQCVLTLQEGDTDLDFNDLVPEELLVSTCAGLVTVDNASRRVQFVHATAQEYMNSIKVARFPDADVHIAQSCIQYLSLFVFATDTKAQDVFDFARTVASYPFLEYAAVYWGIHARSASSPVTQSAIKEAVDIFFNLKHQFTFAVRALLSSILFHDCHWMGEILVRQESPIRLINILAYFGLDFLITEIVSHGEEAILKSSDKAVGNVLHWAALGQHETTLSLLLSYPCTSQILDEKGHSLFTAMNLALAYRLDTSAEILLEHGSDVATVAYAGNTPLLRAATMGNSAIIPKILSKEKGLATFLQRGFDQFTAFHFSAFGGHANTMVELLRALDQHFPDLDLEDLKDDFGRNPLHVAAERGNLKSCEVLLESKFGEPLFNGNDYSGASSLYLAVLHGHVDITETFLEWSDEHNLSSKPEIVVYSILLAARSGQAGVLNMLLTQYTRFSKVVLEDSDLLFFAVFSGSVEAVKAVLGPSGNHTMVNSEPASGVTALMAAANGGHSEVLRYLIQEGATIEARDQDGETCLHYACRRNAEQVIKILLQSGIDIRAENSNGQTALAIAIHHNSHEAIQILLDAEAYVSEELAIPEMQLRRQSSTKGYSPKEPLDQLRVYFYLKKVSSWQLPPFVISRIMDLAEYWLVSQMERCDTKIATRYHGDSLTYLRTAPIAGNHQHPVRRVEFEIISHDQGYSGDTDAHGTYNSSYSWFEARREHNSGPEEESVRRIAGPEILRNVHAQYEWQKHRVSWCCMDGVRSFHVRKSYGTQEEVEYPVSPVSEYWRVYKPEPVGWMQTIEPGDRLVVVPFAEYRAWENHVQRTKAVIYTSFIKASSSY